ncbi:Putative Sexual differentiation process protein isp4 [[Torrubiella] hemipterigena]|uniref:Putative Sexual differentiation process protein isp4 n=1 Tax=[Torrubiella] hemipterigena TaxID=1531966 RepID=A0A0A1SUV3_9HYPO|nr:Putative Sexual differentiation process protein isp4 [[Torrubiella] hemipterigena]
MGRPTQNPSSDSKPPPLPLSDSNLASTTLPAAQALPDTAVSSSSPPFPLLAAEASSPPRHDIADSPITAAGHDRTSIELVPFQQLAMASKKRSSRRRQQQSSNASSSTTSPYGSINTTPRPSSPLHRTTSNASGGSRRHRSRSSRSQSRPSTATRLSEDIDGSVLASGLEGRFSLAEAPLLGDMIDGAGEDKPGRRSSTSSVRFDEAAVIDSELDSDTDSLDEEEENSPHDVVRASVSAIDDTSLSINTPRMWCLSMLFAILGSSTNLFFALRYPSVAITPVIALLLVHPLGHLWDFAFKRDYDPEDKFVNGHRLPRSPAVELCSASPPTRSDTHKTLRAWRQWLGQGRWNQKEHTCVYVSSNVAFGFAFATDVIVEQTQFYNQKAPISYQLLLTISTQVLGYGFAGMARRFLVNPSGMIWPGTLMSAAMFSTLHKQENKPANGWTISRWKFFYVVWTAAFLFYFFPGLLMPALSYFNVITWFAPKSVVLANLFGVTSGLGLFPMTFDWAQITYVGSPLLVPFWAAVNVMGGLSIVMWILAPLCYYTNVLYSSYMPILSAAVFDNTGKVYDVSKILTPEFLFDREAYAAYSRVFLPITYVLSYAVQFAGLTALLTHTLCWHGRDIWRTWKRSLTEAKSSGPAASSTTSYAPLSGNGNTDPMTTSSASLGHQSNASASNIDNLISREDIHSRLMKRYPEAPAWWYILTSLSMTAIGIFIVEYYPIHLPWYGLLLALGIGAVFFIPNGIIMAVTNQHSSIYLICQLICGVVFPGRPIANMLFVTYGYISSAQGIKFASDLKLGHYMKIPPRIMFSVQILATLIASVTQIIVLNWMFANVPSLCTPDALNGFTCPIARVHFNGSILWGVVGPAEFFGPNAIYRALVWAFPLGALLPIPLWLYARNRRGSIIRKVNLPVVFGAMAWIPPATGLNFSVWAVVCYVFNYLIKRRASAWWAKYTMTLSAALDSGLAFGIVVVFFGFLYPGWMKGFSWWGTEVYKQGCDWQACSYKTVPEGGTFGPDMW